MTMMLGVDTGGTFTDAVLLDPERGILAKQKSLTTRRDLSQGVGRAVAGVLSEAELDPAAVGLVALSTTLATNALVEGHGGRVGLVCIGFSESDLERNGLRKALKDDPYCCIAGGHSHAGHAQAPLDTAALRDFLGRADVSAFAIAAQFGVRNPEHELQAAEMVRVLTGRPVSLSHHLSMSLGGPKRALTALLNARLLGLIDRLIQKTEQALSTCGIAAPLMVVRGDGALMSAEQAKFRPIETILSGPAASIVGASWLTGIRTGLVSDIGGTTTDVAYLRDGRPVIDPAGAQVGGFRTMVEAVAMRTTGLGGDSEVHVEPGLKAELRLGPRRLIPLSLLAHEHPGVGALLDADAQSDLPSAHAGRFVVSLLSDVPTDLTDRERRLLERLDGGVRPKSEVLRNRMEQGALKRLVEHGLVQEAGVTPSDAAHVLGLMHGWDADAARAACRLLARTRDGAGQAIAGSAEGMAKAIVAQMTQQTSLALLEAAFSEEDLGPPEMLARHVLMQAGLTGHEGTVRISTGLAVPVVGLGASVQSYYPAVGERLGTDMILPENADVANAIGAVVGQVRVRRAGTITAQGAGRFRVHLVDGPQDFGAFDAARDALIGALEDEARTEAVAAGTSDVEVRVEEAIDEAEIEGQTMFVEARIEVTASGRPAIGAPPECAG